MWCGIVSIFPEMFAAITAYGVTGKAFAAGIWNIDYFNPRAYVQKAYRAVDDRIYGGGPGVILSPEPLAKAIRAAKERAPLAKVLYVSPQGKTLDQAKLSALATEPALIWIAGRYEGIDERIVGSFVDEELSIGDYVLSGGELAVMVALDGMVRLLPGALGHQASAHQDSFTEGLLECPHYTRPPVFEGLEVPAVLMKGDHQAIALWRRQQALIRTWMRRPDVLAKRPLSDQERAWLQEYQQREGE